MLCDLTEADVGLWWVATEGEAQVSNSRSAVPLPAAIRT
jgi:hypothetical protein